MLNCAREARVGPWAPSSPVSSVSVAAMQSSDWLDELTAEYPKKIARNMSDPCGAKCPQLPKVW